MYQPCSAKPLRLWSFVLCIIVALNSMLLHSLSLQWRVSISFEFLHEAAAAEGPHNIRAGMTCSIASLPPGYIRSKLCIFALLLPLHCIIVASPSSHLNFFTKYNTRPGMTCSPAGYIRSKAASLISTASGALVVGGVRDICTGRPKKNFPSEFYGQYQFWANLGILGKSGQFWPFLD